MKELRKIKANRKKQRDLNSKIDDLSDDCSRLLKKATHRITTTNEVYGGLQWKFSIDENRAREFRITPFSVNRNTALCCPVNSIWGMGLTKNQVRRLRNFLNRYLEE